MSTYQIKVIKRQRRWGNGGFFYHWEIYIDGQYQKSDIASSKFGAIWAARREVRKSKKRRTVPDVVVHEEKL